MYLKERIKKFISEEDGNSLVEFALVLPMLIVLTIGGIYLSISFGQKSILNGVNFMEARAGSVRKDHEGTAKKARQLYLDSAGSNQKWLEKTEVVTENSPGISSNGMEDFRIGLSKEGMQLDMLANSLAILSGTKPHHQLRNITSSMTLPVEYVTHKTESGFVDDHSQTFSVVDYETKSGLEDLISKALSKLPGDTQAVIKAKIFRKLVDSKKFDDVTGNKGDKILGTNPELNMTNVRSLYADWGLDYRYNGGAGDTWKASEEPLPKGLDPDSLYFLKFTAKYAHQIKNGTVALQIIVPELSAFLFTPPVSLVMGPLKGVAGVVEKVGNKVGKAAELNNHAIFMKTSFGGQ